MSRKPKDFHLILSISDNRNSHLTLLSLVTSLILLLSDQPTSIASHFFNFDSSIDSTVLAMGMPGPGVDHTDSASSHFMFVKRKDETAKGLLCFL